MALTVEDVVRPDSEEMRFIQETLSFPRAMLVLLRETNLFCPLIDKAIDDIDAALEKIKTL
jgi:hypothetical protein